MKKRICIFSAQYLPHMGGVENYTYNLAKKLVEDGVEVTVVASNVENVASYEVMDGITVYRVPCYNLLAGRFPVLKMNAVFRKINRRLKSRDYDAVIVNTRFYLHSIYGAIFARKKHCRCVFIEHGTSHLTMHNKVLDFIENIVEHTMTWIEKRLCSEFYGVSEACLEWIQHFHIKGSGVFYNSIDLKRIREIAQQPVISYREKYQIPKDAVVISFTGRLLKEKGILTLTQAVANLGKKEQNVYLLIAGDGVEASALKAMCSDHIIMLGRIGFEEIVSLLEETDIFCLPSDSEGMPTSVLEAAACNNYIITTPRGGAKEVIFDESYGMIIPDNRLETVESALEKAIHSPKERAAAIRKTYERLENTFTWDIVAKKVKKELLDEAE